MNVGRGLVPVPLSRLCARLLRPVHGFAGDPDADRGRRLADLRRDRECFCARLPRSRRVSADDLADAGDGPRRRSLRAAPDPGHHCRRHGAVRGRPALARVDRHRRRLAGVPVRRRLCHREVLFPAGLASYPAEPRPPTSLRSGGRLCLRRAPGCHHRGARDRRPALRARSDAAVCPCAALLCRCCGRDGRHQRPSPASSASFARIASSEAARPSARSGENGLPSFTASRNARIAAR